MVLEQRQELTALNIQDSGKMIDLMVKVLSHGMTGQSIQVTTRWVRNTESESLHGQTVRVTLENSLKISFMAMALTNGLMADSMKANGLKARCMERANLNGRMEELT